MFDLDAELARVEANRLDAGFNALLIRRAQDAARDGADIAALVWDAIERTRK